MKMTVGNTLFKKKESNLVPYKSDKSNTHADYCLVRRNLKKILKDIKVLRSEDFITHNKPLA